MDVNCIFESNSEMLRAIWDRGVSLFESFSPDEVSAHQSPYGFLAYLRAYLCLIGDREGARIFLQDAYKQIMTSGNRQMLYMFPIALEHYVNYADDRLFASDMVERCEKELTRSLPANFPTDNFETDALFLGALFALFRLRGKVGFSGGVSVRVALTERFHAHYYQAKTGQYHDGGGLVTPATQILPMAFGFLHEGAHGTIRRWLIEESFSTPRELRLLLYDAVYAEELFDLLMPTLIEGGIPNTRVTPADLSGLVCIVTHLCGVDLTMMGQGIQASTPHFPHGVTYSLTIPSAHVYLSFESEDYPGELVF